MNAGWNESPSNPSTNANVGGLNVQAQPGRSVPAGGSTDTRAGRPRRILRRVGAVLAGFLAIVVLSTGTDMVLHATNVFPPWGQSMSNQLYWLAFAYRVVFSVGGCYLAARLAPDRPMAHAVALGVLGVIVSTAGSIAMWKVGPSWYPLALIAVSLPCGWAGGKLRAGIVRTTESRAVTSRA